MAMQAAFKNIDQFRERVTVSVSLWTGLLILVALFSRNFVAAIMDFGSGISKANGEKIFETFFTTKEVGSGTVLGLSITKGILDRHKASIRVVDNTRNTCFEIKFRKFEVS